MLIFHWKAQLLILFNSLFNSRAEVFLSCVTENRNVYSANNFAVEDKLSDKLFIYLEQITLVSK